MAYCDVTDLKLGNIPIPAYLDAQKEVNDAADEIDSKIGFRYITPVNVTVGSATVRPAVLLLKRINVSLATGRLLLAIASPEEGNQLHAYAWSLIKEATAALEMISCGDVVLDGVPHFNTDDEPASTPLISNIDSESSVEAFYDRIANPAYVFGVPYTYYPYLYSPDRSA